MHIDFFSRSNNERARIAENFAFGKLKSDDTISTNLKSNQNIITESKHGYCADDLIKETDNHETDEQLPTKVKSAVQEKDSLEASINESTDIDTQNHNKMCSNGSPFNSEVYIRYTDDYALSSSANEPLSSSESETTLYPKSSNCSSPEDKTDWNYSSTSHSPYRSDGITNTVTENTTYRVQPVSNQSKTNNANITENNSNNYSSVEESKNDTSSLNEPFSTAVNDAPIIGNNKEKTRQNATKSELNQESTEMEDHVGSSIGNDSSRDWYMKGQELASPFCNTLFPPRNWENLKVSALNIDKILFISFCYI